MRPTRIPLLLAVAAVAGVGAYFLTRGLYADTQSPPTLAPLWLLLLAAAEGYTAIITSARLAGRPRTRPINPIVVARIAALAKATSPVGALAFGGYAGFLGYVASVTGPQSGADTRTGAIGVACSLALVAAALWLERVCRVKRPPGEEDKRSN